MSRGGLWGLSNQKLNVLKISCQIHCTFIVWMARENRSLVLVVESELFVSLGKDALIVVVVNLVKLFKLLCHTALHF